MEGTYFDRALLVTCLDGLGRLVPGEGGLTYRSDVDTIGTRQSAFTR